MLVQRRRRLPNIILQLGQCIWVLAFLTTGDAIVTPIAIAYVHGIPGCCWAIVRHVGATLKQHWLAVQ